MKKILLFALAAVLMAACTSSLPAKMTQLADKVSAKGADFTPEQWEKTSAQFEKLVQQYVDNFDKFNNDQKKQINAAIGKYSAAALKCGVNDAVKQINGILNTIPESVNTALEGAKGFFEELGL